MILLCCVLIFLQVEEPDEALTVIKPIVQYSGNAPQDRFGECLALLGDLDDDGYSDFAVAATGVEGRDGPMTGEVRLYSGLHCGQIGQISGEAPFSRFGMAITSGDLNSDGRMEIIIAEPYYSGKPGRSCGRIGVYSFPTCTRQTTIDGPGPSARFGFTLACMDVNGDGVEDILAGAPGFSGNAGPGCGGVFIYSGATGELVHCLEGETAGAWLGYGMVCIDTDCDGFGDPVIAMPGRHRDGYPGSGEVVAFSGADFSVLYRITGGPEGRFGLELADLPDLNGDGVQELYITLHDGPLPRLSIYDGSSGDLMFTPGETISDLSATHPPVAIGDLDNDGFSDLAVGYSRTDETGLNVFSGRDGTAINRWICSPRLSEFGYRLSTPLERELTGFPRLVIASNPYRNERGDLPGKVGVYHLAPQGIVHIIAGAAEQERFGFTTALIGDTNNDGLGDFVVGAPHASSKNRGEAGRVYLYSGWGGKPLAVFEGETADSRLGEVLSGVGDLDGDGKADFLAAAPGFKSAGKNNMGRVYIYSSMTGTFLKKSINGRRVSERLGTAVLPLADTDDNGAIDFLVASPGKGEAGHMGRIRLFDGEQFKLIRAYQGSQGAYSLGTVLAKAGDLDGDGISEFICTSQFAETREATPERRVFVYRADNEKPLFSLVPPAGESRFGDALMGILDLSDDAVPDLMVGTPDYTDGEGLRRGRIYLFSGQDGQYIGHLTGEAGATEFGSSIRYLSDLDGDLLPDLAVTARVGDRYKIYLLRSLDLALLGCIEMEEKWTGFGCSLAGYPPVVTGEEQPLPPMLIVGADQYDQEQMMDSGASLAVDAKAFLMKNMPPEPGLDLFLKIPSPDAEPVVEKIPPLDQPVAVRTGPRFTGLVVVRYSSGIKSGALPLLIQSKGEHGLTDQAVLLSVGYDEPAALGRWVQRNWSRSVTHLSATWNLSFKVQIMAGEFRSQKQLHCKP